MRTAIRLLLLGGMAYAAPLLLQLGCQPAAPTQAPDAGSGSTDLAGTTNFDLSGTVNPESDPALQGITALHNQARAAVNPQPAVPIPLLTWDPAVAAAAQAVADSCMTSFNSSGYGYNSVAAIMATTPARVVSDWTGEARNYTYATNTCAAGTCSHYTQVVWRDSQKLGCGQKTCTMNSPFTNYPTWYYWVCFYSPAGNVSGQKPY